MKKIENNKIKIPLSELEYNGNSDIKALKQALNYNVKKHRIKSNFLILLLIVYLSLFIAFKFKFSISNFSLTPFYFLSISAAIFIIALLTFFKNFYSGLIGLLKLRVNPNSILFLESIGILAQFSLLLLLKQYEKSFPFIGLLIFFSVLLEKKELYISKKIKQNFKFEISKRKKFAVNLNLSEERIQKEEINRNFDFFKNNLQYELWEKIFSVVSIVSICLSVVFSVFNLILRKDIFYILSSFNFTLIFGFPILLPFVVYFKMYSFTKRSTRKGIMLFNPKKINETSKLKSVSFLSNDLYPAGNVVLKEIKTFHGQRVDEAILYAATLSSTTEGPLNTVFDKIILGQKKMLDKVSDASYEDGKGIIGWVNGKRIMIGNRELLKSNGIDPPSRDYEDKYHSANEGITYIAVGYELIAMFVLEYLPNPKLKKSLKTAEKNNLKICVRTSDSNINLERIAKDFLISQKNIQILPFKSDFVEEMDYSEDEKVFEVIDEKDKVLDGIILSKQANFSLKSIFGIQSIAYLIALIILLSLMFSGTIDQIKEYEIFIFYIFWLIPCVFLT